MSDIDSGRPLRIGTRGSPLALAQAREVEQRLKALRPDLATEVVPISTTGDEVQTRRLSEIGGKGLFTKEVDGALLAGAIDLAVHSMKDVETWLDEGVTIAAILPREDPRDALLSKHGPSLDDLPQGAVVGTTSLRRQAQLLARRPDIEVIMFRGNVNTRLAKLAAGEADATMLAMAGLNRLGMADKATAPLEPEDMLPAAAQGALGVAVRTRDEPLRDLVARLHHEASGVAVFAERAFLAALDGSCRTPIAGLAEISDGDRLRFRGLVARRDGTGLMRVERIGPVSDAVPMGRDAGEELRPAMTPDYFE